MLCDVCVGAVVCPRGGVASAVAADSGGSAGDGGGG